MSQKRKSNLCGMAIVLALVVALASGCGSGEETKKPIKIGVILPLTGAAASLGKATLNGVTLAIEDHNNSGGPEVSPIVEDDQADPALAVSALQKLISSNGVRLVIGPLTSGATVAVSSLAERNEVVILSPGASAPAISKAGDFVFRSELSEEFGSRAQAELAFSRLGLRAVALFYVNNEYGAGSARVFRDEFKRLGGSIVAEEAFAPGSTDFRTSWLRLRSAKPQSVILIFQDEIVNILKQKAELGIKLPVFTTPVFEDRSNLESLGPLAERIVYTYYGTFDASQGRGAAANFIAKYKSRYSDSPSYYSALGYDSAQLMLEALKRSGFQEGQVKGSLYTIKRYPGITGMISFDNNGDVTKPVSLKQVREGEFVAF